MICRRFTVLAVALAAALVLVDRLSTARADAIAEPTYVLSTTQDIPIPPAAGTSAPQAIFEVPPGTIVPPTVDGKQQSPLTIDLVPFATNTGQSVTTSSGIDTTDLLVGLKDGTNAAGNSAQFLGLTFFNNGLTTSQQLVFSLNVADPSNPPTLVSDTPGVTISQLLPPPPVVTTPAPTDTSTSVTPTAVPSTSSDVTNTPEPLSLALWSILGGAGLLRARALRRRAA